MAIGVVSFSSPGLLNRRPGGPLAGCFFLYCILSPTGLQTQSGVPKAPSAGWWLSLPYLVSNSSDLQLTDILSLPSYIIVQSSPQYLPITGQRDVSLPLSLKWHVCHRAEITVMQFTGHSLPVYQSMTVPRDFTLSHFVSQARPRQWNMQFRRLWNGMFVLVGGQYTTQFLKPFKYVPTNEPLFF